MLDIETLGAEPIGEITTDAGRLYVYGPGDVSVGEAHNVDQLSDEDLGVKMLPTLVRQERRESWSEDVPLLPPDVQAKLTNTDVLNVASLVRSAVDKEADLDDVTPESTTPYAYLAKLVKAHAAADTERLRKTMSMVGSTTGQWAKHLQTDRIRLGATVRALDALNIARPLAPNTSHFDVIAQERREDRERMLLTSKATAESAKMLTTLVAAAQELMEKVDKRDVEAKAGFRSQMYVALGSLILGVALSGGALYYAKKSYDQDADKGKADEAAAQALTNREERVLRALEQNARILQSNEHLLDEVRRLSAERAASPHGPASGLRPRP